MHGFHPICVLGQTGTGRLSWTGEADTGHWVQTVPKAWRGKVVTAGSSPLFSDRPWQP